MTEAVRSKALIVEDDDDIRNLLVDLLRQSDFEVLAVPDGRSAITAVGEFRPDLITLDLGLSDLDGVEVCRRIRGTTDAYIIMLTARADEIDRLMGLEVGADDYLTKPFSPRELRARVLAMMRRPRAGHPVPAAAAAVGDAAPRNPLHNRRSTDRAPGGPPPNVLPESRGPAPLRLGELVFDVEARTVLLAGEELDLTRTEFDLMQMLLSNPRRVWSRDILLREVWGAEWASDGHLVEVHMANLRRKLHDDPRQARYVRTVRGVGYRLGTG